MSDVLISDAEKTFIIHGIQENLRCDGRSCLEYRDIELETGVVSNCSGSAHVRLANTDILVGVKAQLETPDPGSTDQGRIEFFVDCTANADPEFEGRGGEDIAAEISSALAQAYRSPKCLDLRSLAVVPGQQVWVLYVDILILECGGSLVDAVSVAVKAALYDLKIPKVSVTVDENGDPEVEVSGDPFDVEKLSIENVPCFITLSKILECGGSLVDAVSVAVKAALYDLKIPKVSVTVDENGDPEVEVSGDPFDVEKLSIENVPCFITLSKVGQQFILDATQEEQACAVGSLALAVTASGKIAALFKAGTGSLHPENVMDVIEVGRDIGASLNAAVVAELEAEVSTKKKGQKGFFL
ncbi:exosome complex component RRP42 [Ixodes scapularis]